MTTAEVCHRHGVSEQTFYRLKAKYSGMGSSDAQRPRGPEPSAEEVAAGVDAGRGGAEVARAERARRVRTLRRVAPAAAYAAAAASRYSGRSVVAGQSIENKK